MLVVSKDNISLKLAMLILSLEDIAIASTAKFIDNVAIVKANIDIWSVLYLSHSD